MGERKRGKDSVDVAGRLEMAEVLAAYMRGEMGAELFYERLLALHLRDETALSLDIEVSECLEPHDQAMAVDPEAWDGLCRVLAFLLTDYAIEEQVVERHWITERSICAGTVLLMCLTAGYLSAVWVWWVFR